MKISSLGEAMEKQKLFYAARNQIKKKKTGAWSSRAKTCVPHNPANTVQHICHHNIIYNSKILETTQMLINRNKNNTNIYSTVRNRLTRATHISHKHVKEDKSWGKIVWCPLYKIKDKYINTYTHMLEIYT